MRCLSCGTESPPSARFCFECGSRLANRCSNCGAENAVRARFCSQCAAPLETIRSSADDASAAEGNDGAAASEVRARGERRRLTVLFTDLVDSTEIALRLDPEEWRELAAAYQQTSAEAVIRFGGNVAQFLGDGLLVLFGYPEARDNEAERSIRAGLAILDGIARLNERLVAENRPRLRARVGIHTGPVVVAHPSNRGPEIFGETPNIAARVQSAAQPNTVLITEPVYRSVVGLFALDDIGPHTFKGVSNPVGLYRVLRPTGLRGRVSAAAASQTLAPFVDHDDELRLLLDRWERARSGEIQVVTIVGEPGIGKSRLVSEFRQRISGPGQSWMECASDPIFQSTALYPISEMLRSALAWTEDMSADERLQDIERSLREAEVAIGESVPLIAPLLNLSLPERYRPTSLAPEQRYRRLLPVLVQWLFGLARLQPLVILAEDLQWSDPSTLELHQLLTAQGSNNPILLVYTVRPEFRPPWPIRAHHAQINLGALTSDHVRKMVIQAAAGKRLTEEIVETVVRRTAGVPLFVEELSRLVVEKGANATAASEVPTTLHDSLMARLDGLAAAKDVVQIGAVIGREFSYRLVRAVSQLQDPALQLLLDRATNAGLLYVQGFAPDATYTFKHALIQDTAYQAILKSTRKELHRSIAKAINELFPQKVAAQPELLAYHYTAAEERELAVGAWQRAADQAVARGTLIEAESHYRKAISVLIQMAETPDRLQRELVLQVALGQVLVATRGFSSREAGEPWARARTLGERLGNPRQTLFVLLGLWLSTLTTARFQAAEELAAQAMAAAERDGEPATLVWGYLAQGATRAHFGDLNDAHALLQQALALYDESKYSGSPQDPGVVALCYAARVGWAVGLPDTARARLEKVLDLARRKSPFDQTVAWSFAAGLCLWCGEWERARKLSEELIVIAKKHHIPFFEGDGEILLGRALAALGDATRALELIRKGMSRPEIAAERGAILFYRAFLAEVQMQAGALDEALTTADEAVADGCEGQFYRSKLLCVRSQVLMEMATKERPVRSDSEGFVNAARSFEEALNAARTTGAKSFELSAATGLARLLASVGRTADALAMLSPIYNSFTEGFDTADLKDAKALLDELNT